MGAKQDPVDDAIELGEIKGFAHHRRDRKLLETIAMLCCDHDDLVEEMREFALEEVDQLKSGHPGNEEVEDDEIVRLATKPGCGFITGRYALSSQPVTNQEFTQQEPNRVIIFTDEHS